MARPLAPIGQRDVTYTPSKFPSALHVLSATATVTADATLRWGPSVTADRTGQWVVICRGGNTSGALQAMLINLWLGASSLFSVQGNTPANNVNGTVGAFWQGFVTSGQVFQLMLNGSGGSGSTGWIDAYFIPTPANPN